MSLPDVNFAKLLRQSVTLLAAANALESNGLVDDLGQSCCRYDSTLVRSAVEHTDDQIPVIGADRQFAEAQRPSQAALRLLGD
jgi:hypothetical protein